MAEVTMQQAVAALGALYERHRETQKWIVEYSLIALALAAREATDGKAATLEFDWSDQGDFLNLRGVYDEDFEDLDPNGELNIDEDSLAWNLAGDNKSAWSEHLTPFRPPGWGSDVFAIDVDQALAIEPTEQEVKA